MLATRLNTFYTKNVKFGRDLLAINEEYRYAKSPNFREVCAWGQICVFTTQTSEKFHFAMSVTFRRSFIYSFHFSPNTVKKFMKINF